MRFFDRSSAFTEKRRDWKEEKYACEQFFPPAKVEKKSSIGLRNYLRTGSTIFLRHDVIILSSFV
ncbi:hypothetical protein HR15_02915 [Porphyromonas gulae]|uniref:Uncharacterized protein n=1 Tax=Porphyromonas gulae TaxID=111105 RepID=A0A0A2FSE5_9PORP|nr:hypothetical protein HR15_02915 [Porphyromonas gulae]